MRSIILVILSLLMLMSCKKSNERRCVKSSGKNQSTTINDIDVTSIEVNDNILLILVNDSLNKIELNGGENLIEFIKYDFIGGKLSFFNTNKCNFLRKEDAITVVYHYTTLDSLFINGFGNIYSEDTIKNDIYIYAEESFSSIDLTFDNQNTTIIGQIGSIETVLHGRCSNLYMYSNGAGKMDARDLFCKNAHGHSQSLGDFYLNASEYLNIELRSAGNFFVFNAENAVQNILNEGSGEIIFQ